MRHVDLCSGIGGFSLGFEWAGLSSPVLFCDVEPWCRQVLSKHWPDVPIACDVKELASDPGRNVPDCDILTAGYPCQPFSLAGKRGGKEDPRHIWPYILRIVASKRPSWCVFENVYGHVSMGLDQVLLDLEAEGYATRPFIVPACGVDAPHKRDRIWIIARLMEDTSGRRYGNKEEEIRPRRDRTVNASITSSANVADTDSQRGRLRDTQRQDAENAGQSPRHTRDNPARMEGWLTEPPVGRVANGIPRRVDRLKGLGNAIVPQIAMRIAMTIKAIAD